MVVLRRLFGSSATGDMLRVYVLELTEVRIFARGDIVMKQCDILRRK